MEYAAVVLSAPRFLDAQAEQRFQFDITSYLNDVLLSGKSSLSIAIEGASFDFFTLNQNTTRNEATYYSREDGARGPKLIVVEGRNVANTLNPFAKFVKDAVFQGDLATIRSVGSLSDLSNLSASIHWGDGTSSPGSLRLDERGNVVISGQHRYEILGDLPLNVNLELSGTTIAQAKGFVRVWSGPPNGNTPDSNNQMVLGTFDIDTEVIRRQQVDYVLMETQSSPNQIRQIFRRAGEGDLTYQVTTSGGNVVDRRIWGIINGVSQVLLDRVPGATAPSPADNDLLFENDDATIAINLFSEDSDLYLQVWRRALRENFHVTIDWLEGHPSQPGILRLLNDVPNTEGLVSVEVVAPYRYTQQPARFTVESIERHSLLEKRPLRGDVFTYGPKLVGHLEIHDYSIPASPPAIQVRAPGGVLIVDGPGTAYGSESHLGTALPNDMQDYAFQITNLGTETLVLDKVTVTGPFDIVSVPNQVEPNAASTIRLQLRDLHTGFWRGGLSIASNDPNKPDFSFLFSVDVITEVADDTYSMPASRGNTPSVLTTNRFLNPNASSDNGLLANDLIDADTTLRLLVEPEQGTLNLHPDGQFSFTAPIGFAGTVTFVYQTSNDLRYDHTGTVTLHILNNAPVANHDGPLDVRHTRPTLLAPLLNDYDLDGDLLTPQIASQPSLGRVEITSDRKIQFVPHPGAMGLTSFTYRLSDGVSESSLATVSLSIVNTPPVALADSFLNIKHSRPSTLNLLGNDQDAESDPLRLTIGTSPIHGTLSYSTDGNLLYQPFPGYLGTDQFTYQAHDGVAASNLVTVSLNVVNNAPVSVNQNVSVSRMNTVETQLTSATSDADHDTVIIRIQQHPSDGRVTIHEGGHVLYERWSTEINPAWTDSFTYVLFDGIAESNVGTVTLNLSNSPPVAVNDAWVAKHHRTLFRNALANDQDIDQDKLLAYLISPPNPANYDAFLFDAEGAITYVPKPFFTGTDTIIYEVSDGWTLRSTGTVTISVEANSPPIVPTAPVVIELEAGEARTIDRSLLVTDSSLDLLSMRLVSDVSHGLLKFGTGEAIVYVPRPGYAGTDSFTYQYSDGQALSAIQTVSLTIHPPQPVAADFHYAIPADIAFPNPHSLLLGAFASNTRSLELPMTASLVGTPQRGTVTLQNNGFFIFYPEPGYSGPASFQYVVNNGFLNSLPATVTLDVHVPIDPHGGPDGPIIRDEIQANEDVFLIVGQSHRLRRSVRTNDVRILTRLIDFVLTPRLDWSGMRFELVPGSGPSHAAGPFSLDPNGDFEYLRQPGSMLSDTFHYRIIRNSNNQVVVDNVAVSIEIAPNTPPSIEAIGFHIQPNGVLTDSRGGSDLDDDPIVYEFAGSSVISTNGDGTYTYRAAPGFTGLDSAQVRAFDGKDYSPWTQWVFEVSNQAPTASSPTLKTHFSKPLTVNLGRYVFDADGDRLAITILAPPQFGTFDLVERYEYRYTPRADALGIDGFTYAVSDGLSTAIGNVTIDVTNTAPKTNWKKTNQPDAPDEYWVRPDGILQATRSANGKALVVQGESKGRIIGFNELVHFGQIDLLGYLGLGSPREQAEITRRLQKDNASEKATVAFNDFDADSDPLTVELLRDVESGSLSLESDGTFLYFPNSTTASSVSFEYRLFDGSLRSDPATVTIHIGNTPPVSQNLSVSTGRGGTYRSDARNHDKSLVGQSSDRQGDQLTYFLSTAPSKGTVTIQEDGSFVYTHTDGVLGSDQFTYTSFDGDFHSQPATVTVNVVNTPPNAKNETYEAVRDYNEGDLFDAVYSVIGDLPVSDTEGDDLLLLPVIGPFHGTFTTNNEGEFVYRPIRDTWVKTASSSASAMAWSTPISLNFDFR